MVRTKKISTVVLSLLCFGAYASNYQMEDINKLTNDKEVVITSFSDRDKQKVLDKFPTSVERDNISQIFRNSTLGFVNNSSLRCELNLVHNLKLNFEANDFPATKADIDDYLVLLRSTNQIDDIFYEFAAEINTDINKLNEIDEETSEELNKRTRSRYISKLRNDSRDLRMYKKLIEVNNVKDLYVNFQSWPDENEFCLYQEWNFIKTKLKDYNDDGKKISKSRKNKIIELLNLNAVLNGHISYPTYKKLEYLREESFVSERYLRLEDYLNVTFKAKNKMKPYSYTYEVQNLEEENRFSTEMLGRFDKITRRKNLYEKYNETQIVLLAQVLQKASRRMGVDPDVKASRPIIIQKFEYTDEDGQVENYVEEIVLDPQSQYNLARRRMRKDIIDLEAMDIFYGTKIYYNDVVMAAFEVGYLSLEDIEFALMYDNLWNPSRTRFEKITGFIFSLTGYATFFVPAPYNVAASLGMAIIEGIVYEKNRKGEDNDNAATFIQ